MEVTKKLQILLKLDMKVRPCAAPDSNWATWFKFIPDTKHTQKQQIRAQNYQCGGKYPFRLARNVSSRAAVRRQEARRRKRSHLPLRTVDGALKTDCCQSPVPPALPLPLPLSLSLSLALSPYPPPLPSSLFPDQQTEDLELLLVALHCKLVIKRILSLSVSPSSLSQLQTKDAALETMPAPQTCVEFKVQQGATVGEKSLGWMMGGGRWIFCFMLHSINCHLRNSGNSHNSPN